MAAPPRRRAAASGRGAPAWRPLLLLALAALCASCAAHQAGQHGHGRQRGKHSPNYVPKPVALGVRPALSVSREGTTQVFRATEPVHWSVTQNSGRATYTQLSIGPTSLTLQAGKTGGGEFVVLASLNATACAEAAADTLCTASATWRVTTAPELISFTVIFLIVATIGAGFLLRVYRNRVEARRLERERRRLKLDVRDGPMPGADDENL